MALVMIELEKFQKNFAQKKPRISVSLLALAEEWGSSRLERGITKKFVTGCILTHSPHSTALLAMLW